MMNPLMLEPSLADSQNTKEITIPLSLTAGTGANVAAYLGTVKPRILVETGTGSALTTITQDAVDELLGVKDDVVVSAAYGTTAMVDNNTLAFVLDCGGQIKEVIDVIAIVNIGGTVGVSVGVGTKTALANAAFTLTEVYVTPAGNIAGRITYTNISAAASAGHVFFKINAKIK